MIHWTFPHNPSMWGKKVPPQFDTFFFVSMGAQWLENSQFKWEVFIVRPSDAMRVKYLYILKRLETTVMQHVWWFCCCCYHRRRKKSIPLVLIPEANYQLTTQAHFVFRPDLVIMHLCCAIDYNMCWVFSALISDDHSKICVFWFLVNP